MAIWDSGRSPHGYCVPTRLLGTRLLHCTRLLRTHTVIRYTVIDIRYCTRSAVILTPAREASDPENLVDSVKRPLSFENLVKIDTW